MKQSRSKEKKLYTSFIEFLVCQTFFFTPFGFFMIYFFWFARNNEQPGGKLLKTANVCALFVPFAFRRIFFHTQFLWIFFSSLNGFIRVFWPIENFRLVRDVIPLDPYCAENFFGKKRGKKNIKGARLCFFLSQLNSHQVKFSTITVAYSYNYL